MLRLTKAFLLSLCLLAPAPVWAALAVDANGNAAVSGSATSATSVATPSFSTTSNGDIIIVWIVTTNASSAGCYNTASGITDTGNVLTWTFRGRQQWRGVSSHYNNLEEWWVYDSSHRSGDTITATIPTCGSAHSADFSGIITQAVTGFTGTQYHTSPFDGNASLPSFGCNAPVTPSGTLVACANSATGTQPQSSVSVNVSTGLPLGGTFTTDGTTPHQETSPLAFTQAAFLSGGGTWFVSQYFIGTFTSQTVNMTSTPTDWGIITDVLAIAGSSPSTGVLGSPSTLMGCCQ